MCVLGKDDSPEVDLRKNIMDKFAQKTGGVIDCCAGVLDGWIVKILGGRGKSYFCRKGFHGINVQILCDHLKRVLWMSTGYVGATHDSSSFRGTTLYKLLINNFE